MPKKALLAALMAGVMSSAGAQSNAVIYGRAHVGFDNYSATGSAAIGGDLKSRWRVSDPGSRFGVRGSEDLGGGLKAVYQIESGLLMDTGSDRGQNGQTTKNGLWASRPSWVGLEGRFGSILLGHQDVYWANGTIEQTTVNHLGIGLPWAVGGISGKAPLGISRQSNVISYTTPQFGSTSVSLYYSPDTTSPGVTGGGFVNSEVVQGGVKTNARLFALRAVTGYGPIAIQFDAAQKKASSDLGTAGFSPNAIPKNTGLKLGAGYQYLPGSQLSVIFAQEREDNFFFAALSQENVRARFVTLNWEHTFGRLMALAQYGIASKLTGCSISTFCDNTKASGWLVGARFNLSRRTGVYALYSKVTNQSNQWYDYTFGGYTSASNLANSPGADPRVFGIGIQHNF